MNFPSIDIQGSILSTDLLSKIRSEQATFQSGKDFRPDFTNAKLKDEISFAWQEAKGQWKIYKSKLARLRSGELGTTETRNFWISPLLTNLGYNLTFNRQAEDLNGKLFSIGYRDTTLDGFPIYAGGYHESLDKRPENKQIRMSPHALVQEYLNYSEHLYGIVTNGRQLRLLRDASRITRLSYVEFNLEKMMEEDLYSDFVLLYRLLHASRMPRKVTTGPDSIIEKYHQDGLEAGSTIRNKLGSAVKKAIQDLANAFINHPNNEELRDVVKANKLNLDEYYKLQLRIIYRLLFLFVIEERNLVYADSKTSETKRFNEIYFKHYSLIRLRRLAKKLTPPESHRHFDLWRSLVSTFSLFEKKQIGEKLGIMSLQGDLFGYNSLTTSSYDLHKCDISNAVILQIMKSLTYFENEQGVLITVNYGGLDVEEFGSVYEGLLELKLAVNKVEGTDTFSCVFDSSNERGTSGSHYTPEELVQPLIKHSLDFLIADKLKEKDAAKALLALKIADIACGSGHILLSAARRIAHELASIIETKESGSKEKVEQPSPGYVRKAMKEVVRNCIYGVDKNPLAVELCKVALWLEAYNPGEPLNFLDHHIKCGDAIVGLAHRSDLENGILDEAFKTLPGDDKDIAKAWRDRNIKERKEREAKVLQLKAEFEKTTENSVQEAMAEYRSFNQLPESSPDDVERKDKAYRSFIDGKGASFLRAIADTQVAQFFIPKIHENKDYLMTDADFRMILSGYDKSWQDRKVAKATTVAAEQRFFHWFIEFPDVISAGGFDCILGNPPYLGGSKISTFYGPRFSHYLTSSFEHSSGVADFVTYFIKRNFNVINDRRFFAAITTDKITQGTTRESSLDVICNKGNIVHGIKSMKWPGQAAVTIAIFSFFKGEWTGKKILNDHAVDFINSFLDSEDSTNKTFTLIQNSDQCYTGVKVYGEGFVLTKEVAHDLLTTEKNNRIIFPYITGDDIVESPIVEASRFVINFFDWPLTQFTQSEWDALDQDAQEAIEKKLQKNKLIEIAPPRYRGEVATNYSDALQILEQLVKPEREKIENNDTIKDFWWLYERARKELYERIKDNNRVLILAQTAKYVAPVFVSNKFIHSVKVIVFAPLTFDFYAILQSSFYTEWVWKYGTKMGNSTLQFFASRCFENFPFPESPNRDLEELERIGEEYHDLRSLIMQKAELGLTMIYNLFHSKAVSIDGKEQSKTINSLQTHLAKKGKLQLNEAINLILRLRDLHIKLDKIVLRSYGWDDIRLDHDFYNQEYLPEDDRVRFTIHHDARKEILKRLIELNHKINKDELEGALSNKMKNTARKKSNVDVNEPETGYGSLFKN